MQFNGILLAVVASLALCLASGDAKLLRQSRYFDDAYGMGGGLGDSPYAAAPTGERAIMTVRGARSPYDGSAPRHINIEDNPYRGHFPRGVYDRLDSGYGRHMMPYGRPEPYGYGPMGSGGYGSSMYPSRIAVTGAFPYGYGSRGRW